MDPFARPARSSARSGGVAKEAKGSGNGKARGEAKAKGSGNGEGKAKGRSEGRSEVASAWGSGTPGASTAKARPRHADLVSGWWRFQPAATPWGTVVARNGPVAGAPFCGACPPPPD